MRRSALAALLALPCVAAQAQIGQVMPGDLPPIDRDYRARIEGWTKRFYRDASAPRLVRISDPVATRDSQGRLLWLVCLEVAAAGPDGRPMPVQRQAFGFAPNYMSAPLERNGSSLDREACDRAALSWHPVVQTRTRR